jgi:hypothetical protein
MKFEDLTTIDQLVDFLSGTQAVAFSVISDKDACYRWIQVELVKFCYLNLSRQGKGVVTRPLREKLVSLNPGLPDNSNDSAALNRFIHGMPMTC